MQFKKTICTAIGISMMLGLSAQVKKTYFVPKAGTLVELMTEKEANETTHLVLTGKLNAIDFRHLRDEFKNLQVLDLSNASISTYAGKLGTHSDHFYVYPPNCIPAYAFCKKINDSTFIGKNSLQHIILSEKIKNIEDAAFKGCEYLKICEIRKKTAPNLLPEALADSISAIFVPLGSSDSYRNKERWNSFAFIEGEPLAVHVQVGLMGNLADELQQLGVQPNDINFLTIEGKMDEADFKLVRNYMPKLVSVDLSACNATTIPAYTFTQKKYLMNIRLPQGLKSIGQRAFSGCKRLCGILELPHSVSAIEYGAFIDCDNLRSVQVTGNQLTALGEQLFGNEKSRLVYPKK